MESLKRLSSSLGGGGTPALPGKDPPIFGKDPSVSEGGEKLEQVSIQPALIVDDGISRHGYARLKVALRDVNSRVVPGHTIGKATGITFESLYCEIMYGIAL